MALFIASGPTTRRSPGLRRLGPMLAALSALALTAGCAGVDGKAGAPGNKGADGTVGVDGKDGATGQTGVDGTSGKDGKDGANGKDATVDPALSPLEKAYVGIGGKDVLLALTSITSTADGANWVVGESFEPNDVLKVITYKADLKQDLATKGSALTTIGRSPSSASRSR